MRILAASIVCLLFASSAAADWVPTGTAYPLLLPDWHSPWRITAGPDGNVWFTDHVRGKLGRVTPDGVVTAFMLPEAGVGPAAITSGADGNLWFAVEASDRSVGSPYIPSAIGRATPAGSVTVFPLGMDRINYISDIAAGADGHIWFLGGSVLFRMNTDGMVVDAFEVSGYVPDKLAAGSDGNMWFSARDGSAAWIGRATPSGSMAMFKIGPETLEIADLSPGPDGNVWFAGSSDWNGRFGYVRPDGVVAHFGGEDTIEVRPFSLTPGPDGNLWFSDVYGYSRFGRITTAGVVSMFRSSNLNPLFITAGPDGKLWFTANGRVGSFPDAWGNGDAPLPGDYDGDGRADVALFRASTGAWTLPGGDVVWGGDGDRPVPADYDGDARDDVAVFRPSSGVWYIRYSTRQPESFRWGGADDVPVPGDYDGDGRADIAVYRPSTGAWYIRHSSSGLATAAFWGGGGDLPVPRDYDGDRRVDIAVFRPSTGMWYIRGSSTARSLTFMLGRLGDRPVPGDYDGDGQADVAVFRPGASAWMVLRSSDRVLATYAWGGPIDIPVADDYDGNGLDDIAVFRPSDGLVYAR